MNDVIHIKLLKFFLSCEMQLAYVKSKFILQNHIESIHIGTLHSCDVCTKAFKTKYKLKYHIDSIHESKVIMKMNKCDICDFKSKNIETLTDHTWRKHLKCEKCNLTFEAKHELKSHMKECHESQDFCDLCNFGSSDKNSLEKHYYYHHNICKFCKELFDDKEILQKHVRSIHKKKKSVIIIEENNTDQNNENRVEDIDGTKTIPLEENINRCKVCEKVLPQHENDDTTTNYLCHICDIGI